MSEHKEYNVHWDGPFLFDDITDPKESDEADGPIVKEGHVLYQLSGTHPIYGPDQLLYIGITKRGKDRFNEHAKWVDHLPDEVTVRLASVAEFVSWAAFNKDETDEYPQPSDEEMGTFVASIESLLIYAHSPAYNSKNISGPGGLKEHIRIYNTGRYGQLAPELSSGYMRGEDCRPE